MLSLLIYSSLYKYLQSLVIPNQYFLVMGIVLCNTAKVSDIVRSFHTVFGWFVYIFQYNINLYEYMLYSVPDSQWNGIYLLLNSKHNIKYRNPIIINMMSITQITETLSLLYVTRILSYTILPLKGMILCYCSTIINYNFWNKLK